MKWAWRIWWMLVVVGGLYGWVLVGQMMAGPNDRVVTLVVTETSFTHAQELCGKYMRTGGGVIGEVGLETRVHEHVVLPCRVVLKEEGK